MYLRYYLYRRRMFVQTDLHDLYSGSTKFIQYDPWFYGFKAFFSPLETEEE